MKAASFHLRYLVAVASMVAQSANAAESADIARGRELAETYCARCHAISSNDASAYPSAPQFRDLHRRWPVEMLQEALVEGLLTGHPDMPEFHFTGKDAAAFITYLETLAPKAAP